VAVGLGVMVGNRLTSDAIAVVVGVVCGVLASIPTSLFILILTRRTSETDRPPGHGMGYGLPYPPVVVIQSDGRSLASRPTMGWEAPALEARPRERVFTVVGEDEEW
jgi:hypothetical protein